MEKENNKITLTILRLGLAFSFFYAAIAGFVNPDAWIGFFPVFIQDIGSKQLILDVWGAIEILTAIWLVTGKKIFIPSVISSGLLLGLIVFNLGAMDIIFRDISILAMAIALSIATYSPKIKLPPIPGEENVPEEA